MNDVMNDARNQMIKWFQERREKGGERCRYARKVCMSANENCYVRIRGDGKKIECTFYDEFEQREKRIREIQEEKAKEAFEFVFNEEKK